jgi:hypothetical protein
LGIHSRLNNPYAKKTTKIEHFNQNNKYPVPKNENKNKKSGT